MVEIRKRMSTNMYSKSKYYSKKKNVIVQISRELICEKKNTKKTLNSRYSHNTCAVSRSCRNAAGHRNGYLKRTRIGIFSKIPSFQNSAKTSKRLITSVQQRVAACMRQQTILFKRTDLQAEPGHSRIRCEIKLFFPMSNAVVCATLQFFGFSCASLGLVAQLQHPNDILRPTRDNQQ